MTGRVARILMGAELGYGLGHLAMLSPIAETLAARGSQVTLAVPRSQPVPPGLLPPNVTCVDAPADDLRAFGAGSRPLPAEVFSDLLFDAGMANRDYCRQRLQAWDRVLTEVRPDVVIGNYAPYLMLAVRGRHAALQVGSGFEIAPDDGGTYVPLPRLRRNPDTSGPVLECVQSICSERGGDSPATLPACFAHAGQFIVTVPELDPYAAVAVREHAGPLRQPGAASSLPRRRVLAYLSASSPSTFSVLSAASSLGLELTVILRGRPPAHWEAAFRRITLRQAAAPLTALLADAALVIHHGGVSLCQEALFAGVSQLILPRYDEQRFNGEAIVRAGTGQYLVRPQPESIARAMRQLLSDELQHQRCLELGQRLRGRWHGSLERIVRRCDEGRGA